MLAKILTLAGFALPVISAQVETHSGQWHSAPKAVPTSNVVDGPLFGNGELGVVLGGPPDAFSFHLGLNSFLAASTSLAKAVGGIDIRIPDMRNASYSAKQNIRNATVSTSFCLRRNFEREKGVSSTLRTLSFVHPQKNILVTSLSWERSVDSPSPSLEIEVAVRGGPPSDFDPHLPVSATALGGAGEGTWTLTAQRSTGFPTLTAQRSTGFPWLEAYHCCNAAGL
ncbi:hypothetical protein CYMTET_22180 [Cymbomonas tetramitiformis]|uniref:Uncharacterized protein n=1 Tax=Cymbomonas tetramitiformis TaxID=36881 RepID=A0AAE0G1T9_9CHLO|nr:hypothetical protein CYMTET_22180 [Cymbomonas tetramitiformis]